MIVHYGCIDNGTPQWPFNQPTITYYGVGIPIDNTPRPRIDWYPPAQTEAQQEPDAPAVPFADEVKTLAAVYEQLSKLDRSARSRVMQYLIARFK